MRFAIPKFNGPSPRIPNPMNDLLSSLNPSSIWLIAGALMIVLELALVPGIGLLFAGLGAISVGIGLTAGWIETLSAQFILFFICTALWTAILWKPLKSFIAGKDSGFEDMVGSTAVVFGQSIVKGKMGKVKWSGTIMKCQLDHEAEGPDQIAPETEVAITGVSKGILIVRAKSPGG